MILILHSYFNTIPSGSLQVVIFIANILNGANLYGYIKCRVGTGKSIKDYATGMVTKQMFSSVSQRVFDILVNELDHFLSKVHYQCSRTKTAKHKLNYCTTALLHCWTENYKQICLLYYQPTLFDAVLIIGLSQCIREWV